MRSASITRATAETNISVEINLDGTGIYDCQTGVGFFDHMLDQLSRHSLIDLTLRAKGDLHIDDHHPQVDVLCRHAPDYRVNTDNLCRPRQLHLCSSSSKNKNRSSNLMRYHSRRSSRLSQLPPTTQMPQQSMQPVSNHLVVDRHQHTLHCHITIADQRPV